MTRRGTTSKRPARLERLPQQYFTALLARVAAEAAKDGEPLVNFGRGNPEVGPPPHVIEAAQRAAADTPSGVGFYRDPPVAMRPGDLVEVEVERVGVLANPVAKEGLTKQALSAGPLRQTLLGAETQSAPSRARSGPKNSPSRLRFRQFIRLTFPLQVQPPGSTST